ncbi:MAG: hypothetical protein ACR2K9_01230 [Solirubrobacteraceae bacterium]
MRGVEARGQLDQRLLLHEHPLGERPIGRNRTVEVSQASPAHPNDPFTADDARHGRCAAVEATRGHRDVDRVQPCGRHVGHDLARLGGLGLFELLYARGDAVLA